MTMVYTWIRCKKSDAGITLSAALARLVAITAGRGVVSRREPTQWWNAGRGRKPTILAKDLPLRELQVSNSGVER